MGCFCYFGNEIGITLEIEDGLPCPQAIWAAIRGDFVPKLLSQLGIKWMELQSGLDIAGFVASRTKWRFVIFTFGLQMAIKQAKSS